MAIARVVTMIAMAAAPATRVAAVAAPSPKTSAPRRRGKPVLSEHVLTERRTLDPGSECPECGGELRLVGEGVSAILDLVAAQLKKGATL